MVKSSKLSTKVVVDPKLLRQESLQYLELHQNIYRTLVTISTCLEEER